MSETKEKNPINIQFIQIIIQISIIMFFTIVWLNAPFFGTGELNIGYFLFMFIAICIATVITLYIKANPDVPIPKRPSQQFTNLIKVITDVITIQIAKNTPPVLELKEIIKNALVWSIRDAETNPKEFDQETLTKAKKYIDEKLFPKPEENLNKEIIKKEVKINNV